MQIFETPQILGGRPIFGLYRGNFGLFCPRKPAVVLNFESESRKEVKPTSSNKNLVFTKCILIRSKICNYYYNCIFNQPEYTYSRLFHLRTVRSRPIGAIGEHFSFYSTTYKMLPLRGRHYSEPFPRQEISQKTKKDFSKVFHSCLDSRHKNYPVARFFFKRTKWQTIQ